MHQKTLKRIAIVISILTVISAALLFASSIWSLGDILTIKKSSCCLPLQCSRAALNVFLAKARQASATSGDPGDWTGFTLPASADTGLCTSITPDEARIMGCLEALAVAQSPLFPNCSVKYPQRCVDSDNRVIFHKEYGIGACSLGFVAAISILLLLFMLGTDGYFKICGPRSSKILPAILFFSLTLLSCGIGLWLATKPLGVFLRDSPLEMQQATTTTISPSSYSSADPPITRKNLFLTFTQDSSDYSLGGQTMTFNDQCKSLSNSAVSMIGFISLPNTAADHSKLPPLHRGVVMMMSCFGLCIFFSIILVVLSLSNSSGTIMNALLWKENDDNNSSSSDDDEIDEKEMKSLQQNEEKTQRTPPRTKNNKKQHEIIRGSVVEDCEKQETQMLLASINREKYRKRTENRNGSVSPGRFRREGSPPLGELRLPRLAYTEEEDSEKCNRMMDFDREPLSSEEIDRLREYIRKNYPEDSSQFEKEVELYEKKRHQFLKQQREYQRMLRHKNNSNSQNREDFEDLYDSRNDHNNHSRNSSISQQRARGNYNNMSRKNQNDEDLRLNPQDPFQYSPSPSINRRQNNYKDPNRFIPQTMSPTPEEKTFFIDPYMMESMRRKMQEEIFQQQLQIEMMRREQEQHERTSSMEKKFPTDTADSDLESM